MSTLTEDRLVQALEFAHNYRMPMFCRLILSSSNPNVHSLLDRQISTVMSYHNRGYSHEYVVIFIQGEEVEQGPLSRDVWVRCERYGAFEPSVGRSMIGQSGFDTITLSFEEESVEVQGYQLNGIIAERRATFRHLINLLDIISEEDPSFMSTHAFSSRWFASVVFATLNIYNGGLSRTLAQVSRTSFTDELVRAVSSRSTEARTKAIGDRFTELYADPVLTDSPVPLASALPPTREGASGYVEVSPASPHTTSGPEPESFPLPATTPTNPANALDPGSMTANKQALDDGILADDQAPKLHSFGARAIALFEGGISLPPALLDCLKATMELHERCVDVEDSDPHHTIAWRAYQTFLSSCCRIVLECRESQNVQAKHNTSIAREIGLLYEAIVDMVALLRPKSAGVDEVLGMKEFPIDETQIQEEISRLEEILRTKPELNILNNDSWEEMLKGIQSRGSKGKARAVEQASDMASEVDELNLSDKDD